MNVKKSGSSAPRGDVANSTIKRLRAMPIASGQAMLLFVSLLALVHGIIAIGTSHRLAPLVLYGIVGAFGILAALLSAHPHPGKPGS